MNFPPNFNVPQQYYLQMPPTQQSYHTQKNIEKAEKLRFLGPDCVYVGDIPEGVEIDEVISLFKKNNFAVSDIFFQPSDKKKYQKNGYAMVKLSSKEMAQDAITNLNHRSLRDKLLRVTEIKNPKTFSSKANLYVKCPSQVNIEELDRMLIKLSCFTSKKEQNKIKILFLRETEFEAVKSFGSLNIKGNLYNMNLGSQPRSLEIEIPEGAKVELYELDRSIIEAYQCENNDVFSSSLNKVGNIFYGFFQFRDESRAAFLIDREIEIKGIVTKIVVFKGNNSRSNKANNMLLLKYIEFQKEELIRKLDSLISTENGERYVIKEMRQEREDAGKCKQYSVILYFDSRDRRDYFKKNNKNEFPIDVAFKVLIRKSNRNLYTKNVLQTTTEDTLDEVINRKYGHIGRLEGCKLVLPEKFGRVISETKYGYLYFENEEVEREVLRRATTDEEIKRLYLNGKVVLEKFDNKTRNKTIGGAQPSRPQPQGNNNIFMMEAPQHQYPPQMMSYPTYQGQNMYTQQNANRRNQTSKPANIYGSTFPSYSQPAPQYPQSLYHSSPAPMTQPLMHQNAYSHGPGQFPHQNNQQYPYQAKRPYQVSHTPAQYGNSNRPNYSHQTPNPQRVNQHSHTNQHPHASRPQPIHSHTPKPISWDDIDLETLNSNWHEFEKLDETRKRNVLGGVIFKSLKNLGFEHSIAKITGMLIDPEVFSIEEIKEFCSPNQKELISRAEEAMELLTSQQLE